MTPLFDLMLRHVAPPVVEEGPLRLLGTILEANPYLGRIVTGRISSGAVGPNQTVKVLDRDGNLVEQGRITKVLAFRGLDRTGVEEAEAGDIVAIAGLPEATVSHTICAPGSRRPPAGPADRSADARHDIPHQRFAARRHRGRQGAEPRHPRAAPARGRGQRRVAHQRVVREGLDGGGGPRRACSSAS